MEESIIGKVRFANKEDIERLVELKIIAQKEGWQDAFCDDKEVELYKITKELLELYLNESIYILVYEIDGEIVATLAMIVNINMPSIKNLSYITLHITNVFTLQNHRKKGIQKELFKECFKFARKIKTTNIELTTNNPIALEFYKRLGFEAQLKRTHMDMKIK